MVPHRLCSQDDNGVNSWVPFGLDHQSQYLCMSTSHQRICFQDAGTGNAGRPSKGYQTTLDGKTNMMLSGGQLFPHPDHIAGSDWDETVLLSNICYVLPAKCPTLSKSSPMVCIKQTVQSKFLKQTIAICQTCKSSTSGCNTTSDIRSHTWRNSFNTATVWTHLNSTQPLW